MPTFDDNNTSPSGERRPDDDRPPETDGRHGDDAHNPFHSVDPAPHYPPVETGEYGVVTEEAPEREMGFFDHLEELRWRLIKSVIALVVSAIACFIFIDWIIEKVVLGPAHRLTPPLALQNLEVMGQITMALQVSLISGLIGAIPVILFQFWGFIKPGLYERERAMAGWMAVATIFCFLSGIAFAYFVMIPTSLGFANSYTFSSIENKWTMANYLSFVLGFTLICGLVFEMPVLSFGLARFGILTSSFLGRYRRHAFVIILIVAAIITPTPDPVNQLILAVPLYGLYEISIYVAKIGTRRRSRDEADHETNPPRRARWT